jgi:hypothetical protein
VADELPVCVLVDAVVFACYGREGWGRVVFCSSVAGFTGGVVGPHYAYIAFQSSCLAIC